MGIHDGHRQRVRERFLNHGLENFDDITALELLLFYAKPQGDTNPLAHALLDRFGSLSAVMDASVSELVKVPGVRESTATLLKLIPAVSRRYLIAQSTHSDAIDSATKAGRFFVPYFLDAREERVYALFLDAKRRNLGCVELGRGVANAVDINARKLASMALERNACYVVLAHNHLSGVALPSAEDEESTKRLGEALKLIGVGLCDHVVVAGCDYVSMCECGML
ncbi:MAG: DNA repair protein RadC [Ruminococcaceae bacterium]|nr:DNA repair protein RadC [Oscillospiraceae bacterium]